MLSKITPENKRASVFGYMTSARNTGLILSSLFAGGIIYFTSVRGVFYVSAISFWLLLPLMGRMISIIMRTKKNWQYVLNLTVNGVYTDDWWLHARIFIIFFLLHYKNALFSIWGDSCISCFFSGDLLRPPHPGSRVRPGAIWRHSRDVSDWVVSGIICGEVFASSFLFFEEWWSKSFTAISHNWGIAVHCYRNSLYPKPLNFLFSKK